MSSYDGFKDAMGSGYTFQDDAATPEGRLEKSRERNREHARRTRLRKKAQLESMKSRLLELQNEAARLQQKFEESSTANILLCMSSSKSPQDKIEATFTFQSDTFRGNLVDHIRNAVRSEALKSNKDATLDINNSSRVSDSDVAYDSDDSNENDTYDHSDSKPRSLSLGEYSDLKGIETDVLRKERNRMHAKLTRDRKKLFTSRLQQMINALERQNAFTRSRISSLMHATRSSSAETLSVSAK